MQKIKPRYWYEMLLVTPRRSVLVSRGNLIHNKSAQLPCRKSSHAIGTRCFLLHLAEA